MLTYCTVQVGVHSELANKMVAVLLADRLIPALGAYETVRAEVAITPAMLAAGASAQVQHCQRSLLRLRRCSGHHKRAGDCSR